MKMKIKYRLILALIMVLTISLMGTGSLVFANDITDTLNEIQDDDRTESIIDQQGDAKKQMRGIVKDIIDVVTIFIAGGVFVSGLITGGQFSSAGDDAQKKSRLKNKLIFHIIGLVFLANYLGLFDFVFKNVQIFN